MNKPADKLNTFISIRVNDDEKKALSEHLRRLGIKRSRYIRDIIRESIK